MTSSKHWAYNSRRTCTVEKITNRDKFIDKLKKVLDRFLFLLLGVALAFDQVVPEKFINLKNSSSKIRSNLNVYTNLRLFSSTFLSEKKLIFHG